MGAKHAEGMGLIGEELETMLLLDRNEIRQRRAVTQHRVYAFDNHQPPALFAFRARQPLVQIRCIIVAEAHQLGA